MTRGPEGLQPHNPEDQPTLPLDELSPEARAFVDKAKLAARRSFAAGLFASPESMNHPRRLRAMGHLWRRLREGQGMTVDRLAGQVGVSGDDLVLFESGLVNPNDMKEGIIENLGRSLHLHDETTELMQDIYGGFGGNREKT